MYQVSDRKNLPKSRVVPSNGYCAALAALALLTYCSQPVLAQSSGAGKSKAMMETPAPGLHAYTRARGKDPNPPGRAGGPLTISVSQSNGRARFNLPGTRAMDPAIFGTPANPAGFEPAPFPMSGISTGKQPNGLPWRLADEATGKRYTIINHFSPFADWYENTTGSVRMTVVDATAIDGAYTTD